MLKSCPSFSKRLLLVLVSEPLNVPDFESLAERAGFEKMIMPSSTCPMTTKFYLMVLWILMGLHEVSVWAFEAANLLLPLNNSVYYPYSWSNSRCLRSAYGIRMNNSLVSNVSRYGLDPLPFELRLGRRGETSSVFVAAYSLFTKVSRPATGATTAAWQAPAPGQAAKV